MASRPYGHKGSPRIFAPESTGASRVIMKRNLDGKYGLAEGQPEIEVVIFLRY